MILLLGGNGYVGQAYQRYFKRNCIPYLLVNRSWAESESQLIFFIEDVKQMYGGTKLFLLNAAGYTGKPNVDACEVHKRECLFGNAVLPGIIASACMHHNIPWGHVSSGCIYTGDGTEHGPFTETDTPNFTFRTNNCSFYSGTKALGEEILANMPDVYIWRLRIPFNEINNPRNYITKLMSYDRLLDASNSISQLDEFVEATYKCWEKHVPFGIYNVTNPGVITTREVVDIIRKSGLSMKLYQFFRNEEEFNRHVIAPRSNCLLDSSKLAGVGIHMTEVHEAVEKAVLNWVR